MNLTVIRSSTTRMVREMPYLEVPKRRARWLTLTSVKLMPMPLAMAGMKRCISP